MCKDIPTFLAVYDIISGNEKNRFAFLENLQSEMPILLP